MITRTVVGKRLNVAARNLLKLHPKLGEIPLTSFQEAALKARLPGVKSGESPIAIAIHDKAVAKLEAQKKRKPARELERMRKKIFDAAYHACVQA